MINDRIADMFTRIGETKPLVHHITNWVTIYDCAQITRAFGALPVMAHAVGESDEMARLASALVLNIGTLTPQLVESMIIAGHSANEKGIPVILDAVGVGATRLRDEKAMEILGEVKVTVIKGNASEVARLAGENVVTRGVEATSVKADLLDIIRALARASESTVVITGAKDIVADSSCAYRVSNGHQMMGCIVGTGCMAASVIGCFASVEQDVPFAAAGALACFGLAGEVAARDFRGPGSYKVNLYDAIFNLDATAIRGGIRVEKL